MTVIHKGRGYQGKKKLCLIIERNFSLTMAVERVTLIMQDKTDLKYRNSKAWNVMAKAISQLKRDGDIDLNVPMNTVIEFLTARIFESGLMREFIVLDTPVPTHLSNDLEEVVTEGGHTTYINKIELNELNQQLTIQFQHHPERDGKVDKVLIFNAVQNCTEYVDERDEDEASGDDLEVLIGLDGYISKYVIRTDGREIIFYSDKQPELNQLSRR